MAFCTCWGFDHENVSSSEAELMRNEEKRLADLVANEIKDL